MEEMGIPAVGNEAFEQAYAKWMEGHAGRRGGERKGRLIRGHRYPEKLFLWRVWWPVRGNFDALHPEF